MSLLDSAINTAQLIDSVKDEELTDSTLIDISDLTNTRKSLIYSYLSNKGKAGKITQNYSFSGPTIRSAYEKIDIIKRLIPKLKNNSDETRNLLAKVSRVPIIILDKLI